MKKLVVTVCAAGLTWGALGCVAVSSKGNRFGSDADVVSNNGHVYVVNKCTGDVRELDMSHSKPFEPRPAAQNTDTD